MPDLSQQRSEALDEALTSLARAETVWAATSVPSRRRLLARMRTLVGTFAAQWVSAAAQIKKLPADSPFVGEEWMTGPYAVLTALSTLIDSLRALEQGRSPVDGFSFGRAPGNRVTIRVQPHARFDRIMFSGFSAEVWMPPGVDEATVRTRAGLGQLHPGETGAVALVLGAGNVTSIPVLDVLYQLYAHNRVVALKLNPLTDPLLDVFEKVFQPLIELGVVRILTGGAEVGGYLAGHDRVQHVHMTGSAATHDSIVFGPGDDGARRKAEDRPLLAKPITSELGSVAPVIVLPGRWSAADLRFQAEHVVSMRLHNGGYNCVAAQVLLLSSDWAQKQQFLDEIRAVLTRAPARPAFYPGSDQRVAEALRGYPTAEQFGAANGRLLIGPVPADVRQQILTTECFAPVLAVVELPGAGTDFLDAAVSTANQNLSGTLGANLIAHPRTVKELGTRFEDAIARLRYGSIAVNAWTGMTFATPAAGWGAFPGHRLGDVQSGIGIVHNGLLIENPERSVLRGPFRPSPRSLLKGELSISPRPPWFVTNRTATGTGRALTAFANDPRWSTLLRVIASAIRG
jgi:aldehyde dehydrogenase (NAD(P)+)